MARDAVVKVAAGRHGLALRGDGAAWAWAWGAPGADVGAGRMVKREPVCIPARARGVPPVRSLAAGSDNCPGLTR